MRRRPRRSKIKRRRSEIFALFFRIGYQDVSGRVAPCLRVARESGVGGDHFDSFAFADRVDRLFDLHDDLDKALATFVLANGAAATGQKVSIFFTFWGLNVIKKVAKPKVKRIFSDACSA